jgi:integrase
VDADPAWRRATPRRNESVSVIRYEGKRGVVWRIKYRDAAGRQVVETLGPAPAWNRRSAQRELTLRLADVAKGYSKPDRITFTEFSKRFIEMHPQARNLKFTTRENYEINLRRHLVPALGRFLLTDLEARPEIIDRYIAQKAAEGLAPKTIQNHLQLLSVMFGRALAWRLVRANPLVLVDRPRPQQPEVQILSEVEIAGYLSAFQQFEQEADEHERVWWFLMRTMVVVDLGTALRRGELLALRWRAVNLLEGRLEVREALVRGRFTTPKSRASRRVIEIGPRTQEALASLWQVTLYRGDDDLVFCHPFTGKPLDPGTVIKRYLKPALARAGIKKPFRPFHDLRHTALTHAAAAGNPQTYVQMRAGHSQGAITERYIHAAQMPFPGATERTEEHMFGPLPPP